MNEIKKIITRECERDIESLIEEFLAACEQVRLETNAANRVVYERQKESLKKQIEKKQIECDSLKANWIDYLHMIDFDRAEEIADPVIKRLKKTDSAALFLMKDSQSLMGRYCVTRLRERLRDVSSDIIDFPIESDAIGGCLDEATILRCLAGSESGRNLDQPNVETAVTRLCGSVNGGIIFIRLSFNDNLEHRPKLLPWLLKEFWCKLVDHLCTLRAQGPRIRVVLTIIALQKLNTDLLDRSLFCEGEDFDQRRIVELPLEMWDREAVKNWLIDHSKLRLKEAEAIALAERICADCPTGLPYHIDTRLRQELNRMTLDKKEPDE